MLIKLQRNKYVITQIINESNTVNLYIAQNALNHRYCVSEIKDIHIIEKILQSNIPEDTDYFDIFSENKFLYIVTPCVDGESLATYVKYQACNTQERISLLKNTAFKFTRFAGYPELLRNNTLASGNVVADCGNIGFNHFIFETEPKNCYLLFAELIKNCFKAREINKLTYLNIILRKLEHGLYGNFAEVYIDLGKLEESILSSLTLVQKGKALFEKHQWILKAVFTVFIAIAAIAGIYKMFAGSGADVAGDDYNPVTRIGTVYVRIPAEEKEQ